MGSSLHRKMRRAQQNGHNPLAQVAGPLAQLKKVAGDLAPVMELAKTGQHIQEMAEQLQAAKGVVEELVTLRDELLGGLEDAAELRLELDRQRAVFLRFLCQSDLLLGPDNYMEKFLATEARYRAEYNAMLLLVKLVKLGTWAKEAP